MITIAISSLQEVLIPEWLLKSLEDLSGPYQDVIGSILGGTIPTWALIFFIAFMPAVIEEITFRGFLQHHLRKSKIPFGVVTVIVGVLFAALHINPVSFLPLVLISVYLSILVELSGSLLPAMLVHLVNNGYSIILFRQAIDFEEKTAVNEISSIEQIGASIMMLVLGGIITVINILSLRKIMPVKKKDVGES